MLPIRSPLGAIGAILVALEGVAGGSLFALDSGSVLQTAMVAAMIFAFVAVTVVVLCVYIYFAVRKPAYLFNPSDISESAHLALYGGGVSPGRYVQVPPELEPILIPPGPPTVDFKN
ncbi:MAG: hypothetical protein AAB528_06780 [Chloroflexota bacterium]